MSSTVFATALSGLQAARDHIDTSTHNIANAETPQFRRQVVAQAAQPEGGVVTTIRSSPVPGADLAQDIVTQLSGSYVYKANLQTIETQADMTGTLLDTRA